MKKKFRLYITGAIILIIAASALGIYLITKASNPPKEERAPKETRIAYETPGVSYETVPSEPNAKKIRERYTQLRAEYNNNDIIGELIIDGTSINYPVVQAKDNEYYLTRGIRGEDSVSGWIFLDYENRVYSLDKNTIIYGHNMKQDEMFHALRYYTDESFYKEHRHIKFNTLYEDTLWEVFAFGLVPVSLNYLEVMPAEKRFGELINELKSLSLYDTGVSVSTNDKILNLSTCSVNPDETAYRYVLSAKLITRD